MKIKANAIDWKRREDGTYRIRLRNYENGKRNRADLVLNKKQIFLLVIDILHSLMTYS